MIHAKVFTVSLAPFYICFCFSTMYLFGCNVSARTGIYACLFTVSPVSRRGAGPSRSLRNICRLHELNPWLLRLVGPGVLDMTDRCLYLYGFPWAKMCHPGFRKRLMENYTFLINGTFRFKYVQRGEGNGNPLQYSCLENPTDGGAWWAAVHGSLRVRHDWATSLSLFTFMHWRRKWQSTPVFLLENPRDGRAWWAAVCGVAQGRTRLVT